MAEPAPRDWPIEPFELIRRSVGAAFGLTDAEMRGPKRGVAARHCVATVAHIEGWTLVGNRSRDGMERAAPRAVSLELTSEARAALAMLRDPRLRPTGNAWWVVPAEARGPNLWAEWRESHAQVRWGGRSV